MPKPEFSPEQLTLLKAQLLSAYDEQTSEFPDPAAANKLSDSEDFKIAQPSTPEHGKPNSDRRDIDECLNMTTRNAHAIQMLSQAIRNIQDNIIPEIIRKIS